MPNLTQLARLLAGALEEDKECLAAAREEARKWQCGWARRLAGNKVILGRVLARYQPAEESDNG